MGGLFAHSEASVRVSRSQNVQVDAEGKQQRQQQWGGNLVTVVWATVVSWSDVVVSSKLIALVVDSLCVCCEVDMSVVVVVNSLFVVSICRRYRLTRCRRCLLWHCYTVWRRPLLRRCRLLSRAWCICCSRRYYLSCCRVRIGRRHCRCNCRRCFWKRSRWHRICSPVCKENTLYMNKAVIQRVPKNGDTKLTAVSLLILNRFSKITVSEVFIKDPTAPHMRRYTSLWNIDVRKWATVAN